MRVEMPCRPRPVQAGDGLGAAHVAAAAWRSDDLGILDVIATAALF